MAIAFQCDRCNKYYYKCKKYYKRDKTSADYNKLDKYAYNSFTGRWEVSGGKVTRESDTLHLCPECFNKLIEFMLGGNVI